jgi:hypothetical protein
MKKMYALIVCVTVCGAAVFAQTEAGSGTKAEGGGVVITGYKGPPGVSADSDKDGGEGGWEWPR